MERCNTCKWWSVLSGYRPGVHYCKHPKIAEDDGQDFGTDGMVYPYSEGTGMFTGPDFGCVHHEPHSLKTGPSIQPNN